VIRAAVQSATATSGAAHAFVEHAHNDELASMQHAPPGGAVHAASPLAPATSSWHAHAPLPDARHAIGAQVQVESFDGQPS
jgi:hypothetical protein